MGNFTFRELKKWLMENDPMHANLYKDCRYAWRKEYTDQSLSWQVVSSEFCMIKPIDKPDV